MMSLQFGGLVLVVGGCAASHPKNMNQLSNNPKISQILGVWKMFGTINRLKVTIIVGYHPLLTHEPLLNHYFQLPA